MSAETKSLFKAYSSIENHYLQSYLDNVLACADFDAKEEWVATEKVGCY